MQRSTRWPSECNCRLCQNRAMERMYHWGDWLHYIHRHQAVLVEIWDRWPTRHFRSTRVLWHLEHHSSGFLRRQIGPSLYWEYRLALEIAPWCFCVQLVEWPTEFYVLFLIEARRPSKSKCPFRDSRSWLDTHSKQRLYWYAYPPQNNERGLGKWNMSNYNIL